MNIVNQEKCVWCGSIKSKKLDAAVSVYGKRVYYLAYCPVCGTKWAVPFDASAIDYESIQEKHVGYAHHCADNEWINTILGKGQGIYWTQLAIDFLCQKSMDTRYVYALEKSVTAAKQKRSLRILEVGCNLGYIGAVMLRQGHRYVGLDVQKQAVLKAKEYYGDHFICETVEQYASHCHEKFDLICAFDVLEHVSEPRQFLDSCLSLLDNEGFMILTTPDGDQMRQEEWATDLPPIHLTVFSRRSFTHIASRSLRVRFVDDVQPAYSRLSLQRYIRLILGGRLRKSFSRQESVAEAVPILDPLNPGFYYGPKGTDLQWRFAAAKPGLKAALRQFLFTISAIVGLKPIGYTMVVELSRSL